MVFLATLSRCFLTLYTLYLFLSNSTKQRRRNKSREEVPDNVYIESGDGPIGTHDNVESGEGASSGGSVNSRSRAASIKSKFSAFGGSIKSKFSRKRSGVDQHDEQDGYTNADGVYM